MIFFHALQEKTCGQEMFRAGNATIPTNTGRIRTGIVVGVCRHGYRACMLPYYCFYATFRFIFKVLSMSKGETYDKHAANLLDLPQVIMLNLLYLFDLSISQAKYHTVDIACKFNEYCTNRSIVHQALPSMLGALHANMHIPSCSVCYCDFFCSPYSVITYMIAPSLDT